MDVWIPLLAYLQGPTNPRRDIHTDISHYNYNMYHARIKLVYKYSEARLMLQSLPSNVICSLITFLAQEITKSKINLNNPTLELESSPPTYTYSP